jgi:hypothetical protein
MSHSITAGGPLHGALELRRAETPISASRTEVHRQEAPVDQFPENHDVFQ